jgi:hypothetical protein
MVSLSASVRLTPNYGATLSPFGQFALTRPLPITGRAAL